MVFESLWYAVMALAKLDTFQIPKKCLIHTISAMLALRVRGYQHNI